MIQTLVFSITLPSTESSLHVAARLAEVKPKTLLVSYKIESILLPRKNTNVLQWPEILAFHTSQSLSCKLILLNLTRRLMEGVVFPVLRCDSASTNVAALILDLRDDCDLM